MEIIDRVKLKLGIKDNSHDELLLLLIDDSTDYILSSTNRKELLPTMKGLVERLTIEFYNQTIIMQENRENDSMNIKSESHSEGGVSDSVTYFDLQSTGNLYIPNGLKHDINKFTLTPLCLFTK